MMEDGDTPVERLARGHRVETMVRNVARSSLTPILKDLCQCVYEILLRCDPGRLEEMERRGELDYFVARVILNQYRSATSPFHMEMRRFSALSSDIDGHDYEEREE